MGVEDVVQMLGFRSDAAALLNILDVQLNASYGTEATSMALLGGHELGIAHHRQRLWRQPLRHHLRAERPAVPQQGQRRPGRRHGPSWMDHPEEVAIMREKALETYQSRFTGEVFARNTEQIYENVLKGASK